MYGWQLLSWRRAKSLISDLCAISPLQGNGAEMLRLACSLATERGVTVIAPVHDALMIEAR